MKHRIAVIDSLHCGSVYGLLPQGFKTSTGARVPLNAGQAFLWRAYLDYIEWIHRQPLQAVVVLGDVIDGRQGRQLGSELCLTTPAEQIEAAERCLRALRCPNIYIVQGTEYHDDVAASAVEELAARIGAIRYRGPGQGYRTREVLDLRIGPIIANFAHHGPGVVGLYRATGADKEGIFSALAGKEGKAPKAHLVVRGHWHFYVHVEHASKHVVYCPCWQLQTRYMRHRSVYRMLPDIGGLLVIVDTEDEDDPVRVYKRLYGLPSYTPDHLRR